MSGGQFRLKLSKSGLKITDQPHIVTILTCLTSFSLVSRITLTALCLSIPITGNIRAGDLGWVKISEKTVYGRIC